MFKRNFLFSIIGILLNTLFPVILFPYISRVLGAEGLGTYNYYNQAVLYIALFASFGSAIYGVKEIGKHKNNSAERTQAAIELIIINLASAMFWYLIITCFSYNTSYRADIHIILLLSIILISNAIGAEWFFVAIEYQHYILIRNFITKIISLTSIFLFIKSPNDFYLYVVIVVAGLVVPSVLNFIQLFKHIDISTCKRLNLRRHLRPLFLIFTVEISVRYFGMVDIVVLGTMQNKIVVGYYTLAFNIFSLISSFITVSAVTLLPRAAFYLQHNDWKAFYNLINSTISFILFMGLPCSVGMYVWAELIIDLLGGPEFAPSITILRYFACSLVLFSFTNMLVFQFLYPINKTKSITIGYIAGIVVNLILNFTLIPVYSMIATVLASIASQIIICFILLWTNWVYVKTNLFNAEMLKTVLAGITLLCFSFLMKHFMPVHPLSIGLQIVCSGILYFSCLFFLKEHLFINYILKPVENKWKKRLI